jgi:hypothetical protein
MYIIHYYTNDNLVNERRVATEMEAVTYAYEHAFNDLRVAHIIKDGTTHGLYIARSKDLNSDYTLQDAAENLRNWWE